MGRLYAEGQGVRQDYSKAKIYYEKSCNLNSYGGCFALAVLYTEGSGVRQSPTTAKEYFGKACDMGYQPGCDAYRELNEKGF